MSLSADRIQWIAWAMTLMIESAGAAALWWAVGRPRPSLHRLLWTVLAVNALTHPLFWLALRHLRHAGPNEVLLGELLVSAVEAALYAALLALPAGRALAFSLGLNALSWFGGNILWPLLLYF